MADRIWTPPGGSADPQRNRPQPEAAGEPEPAHDPGAGITPEQLAEQLRRLRVEDVLVSALSTLAQLAYAKLDEDTRELDQARLAIDALRALVPVLETAVPAEVARDLTQVVSNLQLAYASAVGASGERARAGDE